MDTWAIRLLGTLATTFFGLLIFVARLYYTGKLVPRSTIDDMRLDFERQIARERELADYWRQVATNALECVDKQSSQIELLLQSQKTIEAFIISLPRPTQAMSTSTPARRAR